LLLVPVEQVAQSETLVELAEIRSLEPSPRPAVAAVARSMLARLRVALVVARAHRTTSSPAQTEQQVKVSRAETHQRLTSPRTVQAAAVQAALDKTVSTRDQWQ
jgi:hypothetical protein